MLFALAGLVLQVAAARPDIGRSAIARTTTVAAVADANRPPSELSTAGQRYAGAVRGCYEREGLRVDPDLVGTLDVSVTIVPQGHVRDVKVDTLQVHGQGMRAVARCVATLASHWHFSAGSYEVEETIFTFKLMGLVPDSTKKKR